jgi:hypothetical protein
MREHIAGIRRPHLGRVPGFWEPLELAKMYLTKSKLHLSGVDTAVIKLRRYTERLEARFTPALSSFLIFGGLAHTDTAKLLRQGGPFISSTKERQKEDNPCDWFSFRL